MYNEQGQSIKDFNEIVKSNKAYPFYGICGNEFKIGSMIWEAIEDPDDGYRSYFDSIQRNASTGIFFKEPIAIIKIEKVEDDDRAISGYRLVDTYDGHEWLLIGTDYSDRYYPCFEFRYNPKGMNLNESH